MAARVRLAVAEALIKLQSAPAEITLLAALRNERWMIRRNAAAVLGQIQADWAVEPLIQSLRDPIEAVRRVARAALERIGTAEALAAIHAPEVPADENPQTSPIYDRPVGTILLHSHAEPEQPVTPTVASPTLTDEKPPEPVVETPAAKPDENKPETTEIVAQPSLSSDVSESIKVAAILDEPPPSEEDTKPIRPLPDDVS